MSNYDVARYLLLHGLPNQFEGVVFLDNEDRKMILMRQGMNVVRLNQSGIPPDRRFSFYDQIHTTGMDIHQAIDARAALTLGKDMTFRDYAQGAFRMRGIGKGQTIELFVIPEVMRLVNDQMVRVNGPTITPVPASAPHQTWPQGGQGLNPNPLQSQQTLIPAQPVGFNPGMRLVLPPGAAKQLLVNVAAWLTVNGMKSENMQFRMLCHQSIDNVSRKRAFAMITTHYRELTQIAFSALAKDFAPRASRKNTGSDIEGDLEIEQKASLFADDNEAIRTVVQAGSVGKLQNAMIGIETIQKCLDILSERLDFTVPNSLPIPVPLSDVLRNSVMRRQDFIKNDYDKAVIDKILMVLVNSEGLARKRFGEPSIEEEAEDDQDANIQKEQVAEEEVLKEQVCRCDCFCCVLHFVNSLTPRFYRYRRKKRRRKKRKKKRKKRKSKSRNLQRRRSIRETARRRIHGLSKLFREQVSWMILTMKRGRQKIEKRETRNLITGKSFSTPLQNFP